ncbi:hypothetical protein Tco_1389370, partial [Tanacetum coccineum]
MSLSLAKNVIVAGADNRLHMLDKTQYSSWASRILLYIRGKENGKLLVDSILNGPFKYGTVTVPRTLTTRATVRDRIYDELKDAEKIRERVELLIEGSEISLQERESKLYDEFDMFTSVPEETINTYYLSFAQLINDMHSIGMTMMPIHINTKFLNHLQLEWSKFVTDVKLAKDLHNTNFNHLKLSKMEELRSKKFREEKIRGQAKVIRYYNCQEEGHMARQYTKPKRPRNSARFKEKAMLAKALESLMEIPTLIAFQTDDLDAFDSDCDKTPSISAILMAKLSLYDLDILSEIHSLKQLNETVQRHKELSTTVDVLKMKSKAKEDKYLDEFIELEKQKKALDNVIYKMGQSMQTMHMLTKPQASYDESHKTTLGYQNPLYL